MLFTFLENAKNGANIYVGTTAYDRRLVVNATRQSASNNGVKTDIVRASLYFTEPAPVELAVNGDCCAPKGVFTKSVRVELSAPVTNTTALTDDLRALANLIDANPRLLQGLKFAEASDFEFPAIVTGG